MRFAVIGVGNIGFTNVKALHSLKEAEIIAVGPGTVDTAMEVTVGQKVIYTKYAGTTIKDGENEYIIVKQSDIIAIVEK